MALGRPVLATDVGAVGRVVAHGENGWLVPPGDEMALQSQLVAVLADRTELARIGLQAKETLFPNFSAKRQAAEVVDLYEKLVK
jgi:glycosyltransferase involved in cell wall biosynthesis